MSYKWRQMFYVLVVVVMCYLVLVFTRFAAVPGLTFKRQRLSDKWILTADTLSKSSSFLYETNWNILQMHSHKSRCGQMSKETVLQAITKGAKYIYMTHTVDETTSRIISRFEYGSNMSALQYNGKVPNPIYLHFHNTLNTSHLDRTSSFHYRFGTWNTSLVQKLVQPIIMDNSFQYRAPTLLLSSRDMSPFTFNNILFHYDSYWAIIPLTNTTIWSLWVQRLLRELDNSVSFSTNNDVKSDECVMEKKIDILVIKRDLNSWQCKNRTSFATCMLSLSDHLLKLGYFSKPDYAAIEHWLWELLMNGYQQPKLPLQTSSSTGLKTSGRIHRLLYHPSFRQMAPANFKSVCPSGLSQCEIKSKNHLKSLNILLVIVFNRPGHYGNIPYLESVYRPYFKYILYCGQRLETVFKHYNSLNRPVSFIEVQGDFANGVKGYQCLRLAMLMNYDVDGYLHVGDDVLLNVWNLQGIPTDKSWFQQTMRRANISQPDLENVWKGWWGWHSNTGHKAVERALNELKLKAPFDTSAKTFVEQLARNAGGSNKVFYEVADIFYIPQILSKQFSNLAKMFDFHNVHLEIAIPTIINGLSERKDIQLLKGDALWYNRHRYREVFSFKKVFLHALKPSSCFVDKGCREFMCKKYLPCINELILDV